jgi:hypothetical protein
MFSRNDWARKRYASDPEYRRKVLADNRARRADPAVRARRRARRHGLSWEEVEAMSARQGGACAICKQKPARGLVIDHCHLRNKVRALLCNNCNSGLGFFQDSPRLLQMAIEYIVAWIRDENPEWGAMTGMAGRRSRRAARSRSPNGGNRRGPRSGTRSRRTRFLLKRAATR